MYFTECIKLAVVFPVGTQGQSNFRGQKKRKEYKICKKQQRTTQLSKPVRRRKITAFIKIHRADFERSANMPKQPLMNYPQLNLLLHKTPKNRISISLVPYSEFHLNPACTFVSSDRHRVQNSEYTRHFLKTTFPDSWDKREDSSKSQHRFFSRRQYFPYRESKKSNRNPKNSFELKKIFNRNSLSSYALKTRRIP